MTLTPPRVLNDLKCLSAEVGADPLLVQAAGGNTSVKDGNILWVKASGKWLQNAVEQDIFVPVDRKRLNDAIAADHELPPQEMTLGDTNLWPSIETSFHAALPHKFVLHMHPVSLLSWVVRQNPRVSLESLLKDLRCAWIPYVKPGWPIAKAMRSMDLRDIDIIILENHGLIVGGETLKAATAIMRDFLSRIDLAARPLPSFDEARLQYSAAQRKKRLPQNRDIQALAFDPACYEYCKAGVLYPDQAVFLGPSMFRAANYEIVKDDGVFVSDNASASLEAMLQCHADVLRRLPPGANLRALDDNEVQALLNWDAEKYRQAIGY